MTIATIAQTTVLNPMATTPFQVENIYKESYDTFTVELIPPDQHFVFLPGQFNMLYVYGVGEIPISISGDPLRTNRLYHTTRAVGTVTNAMRKIKKNDPIGIRGPFGSAWPIDRAEGYDVVFVAGGIGLAPLRPALYHIINHRDKYGKVVLLYGTRSPDDMLYRKELEKWRARFDLDVFVTVDYAQGAWRGNVGLVTKLITKAPFDGVQTMAIVCGPEVMMRFTAVELLKRGVLPENIFFTMERNMKCAIGLCGHCQFGAKFICKDGPVFAYPEVQSMLNMWEI